MVVYSINQHSAIDFIRQDEHVLLVDSTLLKEGQKLEYHLSNCRISWGLEKNNESIQSSLLNTEVNLFYDGQFGAFGDQTFMRVEDKIPYKSTYPLSVDLIIISGKRELDIEKLADAVRFDCLILDSSVPFWKQNKVKEQATEMQYKYFNVNERGAFIIEN
jgi:hypothetical protein